ncbi:MAG: hypothetical protein N2C14_03510, partial [Planctomycetales bacterium]
MADPEQTATSDEGFQENLVAYLDGELEPQAAALIEERIANDPVARRELQAMEQVWDALDKLPRAEADADFTNTTVELVAEKAEQEVALETTAYPRLQVRRRFGGLAAAAVAAAVGFFAGSAISRNADRQLLNHLPILSHLEEYRAVDSAEFLAALRESGLFTGSSEEIAESAAASSFQESASARRTRVREMDAAAKDQLRRDWDFFQAASGETQDRWRSLQDALVAANNREELLLAMRNYHRWLQEQTPTHQREILALPVQERIARVAQLKQEANALSEEDVRGLIAWWGERMRQLSRGAFRPPENSRAIFMMPRMIGNLSPEEFKELTQSLTERTRQTLLKAGNTQQQQKRLGNWIRETLATRMRNYMNRDGGLSLEQYESGLRKLNLSPRERDQLESLPGEEMKRRIQQRISDGNRRPDEPRSG